MPLSEFQVVGRHVPTKTDPNPKLYKMRLFAPNEVVAASRFWYFIKQVVKMKKASGEIVACNQVYDKTPMKVKNVGIFLRYNSRSGTHNMYKEYRALTRTNAVEQLYSEMAGRHRASFGSIQLINMKTVPAYKAKRASTKLFTNSKIAFPLTHRVQRASAPTFKRTFRAARGHTFF